MKHPVDLEQSGLWIDQPEASELLARSNADDSLKAVARDLMTSGLSVIRSAHSTALCQRVIDDYERYVEENRSYVRENLDELGREKRLVNFHLWSEAAAEVGTAPRIMNALDFLFGQAAAVYTSLTFKYGTQQPVHRDTPHFATWPANMFVGVWTALERVDPSAGPLFYHPGAQRFAVDRSSFFEEAVRRLPNGTLGEQLYLALDLYNGEIIRRAPEVSTPQSLELEAGDSVIWHPQLPHGGSPATDPMRTRWSIVFHCAPVSVQVHQHDRFFTHRQRTSAPPDRYKYTTAHGRKVALAGGTAYM